MNILLTGATGFLGSQLAKCLVSTDMKVTAAVRHNIQLPVANMVVIDGLHVLRTGLLQWLLNKWLFIVPLVLTS